MHGLLKRLIGTAFQPTRILSNSNHFERWPAGVDLLSCDPHFRQDYVKYLFFEYFGRFVVLVGEN